jgi:4-alpha-glucanotransferase
MRLQFYLRYHTSFGQSLWISTNGELGTDIIDDAIPMTYMNEEFWFAELKIDKDAYPKFRYKYILKNADGEIIPEFGTDRLLEIPRQGIKELQTIDTWNHAGDFENIFYSAPFQKIFLTQTGKQTVQAGDKGYTHLFKVKAPLLQKNEVVCFTGNTKALGNWSTEDPDLFVREGNWWVCRKDLADENFPIAYKYGIYNVKEKKFIAFENGNNRLLYGDASGKKLTVIHDGFARFANNTWKGAGVAIPVFSLRSEKSFGVGEFSDLKLLADWAHQTGLKMIQILPVNDTTATKGWTDSYPYAAISAFALHPLYVNLESIAGKKRLAKNKSFAEKQKQLNALPEVDYVEVINTKLAYLREIYNETETDFFKSDAFLDFFSQNKYWLVPYAAFSYLRDLYGTADFSQWPSYGTYNKKQIEKLSEKNSSASKEIFFHYFIQFHLHKQLKEAADYAHKKGVALKGDIAIGVYRYGCDTWMNPDLFHMEWQAGAPPDDFAVKGQNWGFPTYNWQKMQQDHFDWWRKRFKQMQNYFDAFRIDHILGFFRIWSIPRHAIEGVMGRFVPAIPVRITEFAEKGISFDYHRFCKPFITDEIVYEIFGHLAEKVKQEFLLPDGEGMYRLHHLVDTQQKTEEYFLSQETTEENHKIKQGLFDLISNVILFEETEPGTPGQQFHFRIAMEHTRSFRYLDWHTRQQLKELYIDYFYYRQDAFWKKEAMHKLPYLKRATNMLICGEDLGMVPHCVPDVMKQLGILSLEIQRMPKKSGIDFFDLKEAPYLSVVTPSTHDMSTIRGWWEEDKQKIKIFYNQMLGQWGDPPFFCEPWINRAIVLQHLSSPAMWSIFQWQDLLGMSETLRRQNPHEERINVPADPNNKWKYRMHITLENLLQQKEFNSNLHSYLEQCGR